MNKNKKQEVLTIKHLKIVHNKKTVGGILTAQLDVDPSEGGFVTVLLTCLVKRVRDKGKFTEIYLMDDYK